MVLTSNKWENHCIIDYLENLHCLVEEDRNNPGSEAVAKHYANVRRIYNLNDAEKDLVVQHLDAMRALILATVERDFNKVGLRWLEVDGSYQLLSYGLRYRVVKARKSYGIELPSDVPYFTIDQIALLTRVVMDGEQHDV